MRKFMGPFIAVTLAILPAIAISKDTGTEETSVMDSPEVRAVADTFETSPFEKAVGIGEIDILLKVVRSKIFDPKHEPEDALGRAESMILEYVRPLPAAMVVENLEAYEALARIDPDNATYESKVEHYTEAKAERREQLLAKLKTERDDFKGVTFYEHPSVPRYANTRPYIQLYVVEGDDRVYLRMDLHYTSGSWLFIQNAQVKIDGEVMDLPVREWKRDNGGGDIWEWSDTPLDEDLREIVGRIALSDETIIRFNGRQYYDEFEVTQGDKTAIVEMFGAEHLIKDRKGLVE